MSAKRILNIVNGEELPNRSGDTFSVTNPATGQVEYEVEIADDFIKEEVLESAKNAFKVWSATPAKELSLIHI